MRHNILGDVDSRRICEVLEGRDPVSTLRALGATFHQHRNLAELDANDAINWSCSNVGVLRAHVFHGVEEHSKG